MPPMQQLRPDPIAPNRTGTLVAFMVAHFGHHLCTTAVVPLLPMIRDSFDLDYLRSGLLLPAFSLAYGLVQLPMGAISDRFGKGQGKGGPAPFTLPDQVSIATNGGRACPRVGPAGTAGSRFAGEAAADFAAFGPGGVGLDIDRAIWDEAAGQELTADC